MVFEADFIEDESREAEFFFDLSFSGLTISRLLCRINGVMQEPRHYQLMVSG